MKGVQTVVLDEVDVLFLDDSFDLSTLGATTPASAQFLFVTATLPVPVADQVRLHTHSRSHSRSCRRERQA
jgi:superfamily II DNA/RNA helicase